MMHDREKLIKDIERQISEPTSEYVVLWFSEAEYVLELLKKQEAVKPKSKVRHGANAQIQHFCGYCNTMLHGKPKFCSECGRWVKWE